MLFRRFIDDIIWLTLAEMHNQLIEQEITSAFAHSVLELMFRSACKAGKTDRFSITAKLLIILYFLLNNL